MVVCSYPILSLVVWGVRPRHSPHRRRLETSASEEILEEGFKNPTSIIYRWRLPLKGAAGGQQSPKNLVGPSHCRPESFCASGKFLQEFSKLAKKWSLNITCWVINLNAFSLFVRSFGTVWKAPDSLQRFNPVWKVSWVYEKVPDSPKSFWIVWIVCGQSGTFLNSF